LAKRGYDLILIARRADKLAELAEKIRAKTGRQIELFPADLTDELDVARVETLLKADPEITLLVNNAGIGGTGTLLQSDVDTMSSMIALNVTALMRLTYALVPKLVARGEGTIINIASVVAITPETLNGVYGGTKAFVLGFSQNLHKELENTGVTVQVVLPGATATDFWSISGRPVELLPHEIVMSSDDLVDSALVGLDRGEFATIPSLQDEGLFNDYESARQAMLGELSNARPAQRYRVGVSA
jgi:short-subunit dehydrogenase